jgi:ribosomal protein L7/L12
MGHSFISYSSKLHRYIAIYQALQIMDQADHGKIKEAQKSGQETLSQKDSFAAEYVAKRVSIRAAAKEKIGLPKQVKFPTGIDQKDAKKFLPPDTNIWRGLVRREWCGHCPPRKRIQSPWSEYTEEGAMIQIIRTLWLQWLELHGFNKDMCPYSGLL